MKSKYFPVFLFRYLSNLKISYGRAGFVIFWMLNYCGMLAVYAFLVLGKLNDRLNCLFFLLSTSGLVLESMITLLTMRFIPFFMLVWILGNNHPYFLRIPIVLKKLSHSKHLRVCFPHSSYALFLPVWLRHAPLQHFNRDAVSYIWN